MGRRRAAPAFGFQRLAIQDVSPGGRQPMTSASGRCTIVYNGEIYSSTEIRARLGTPCLISVATPIRKSC